MRPFEQAQAWLGELDTPALARLFALASDLSLLLDAQGRILDFAHGSPAPPVPLTPMLWQGQAWTALLASDSLPKATELLRDAGLAHAVTGGPPTPWRQLNFEVDGVAWAASCMAVWWPDAARILVLARDLSALSSLQQRLVQAQQAMERDYWSFRQAETRYRHLFHVAQEAVLVVDAGSHKVLEANPAAQQLIGPAAGRALVGALFPIGFDQRSSQHIADALVTVRATGNQQRLRVELADAAGELEIGLSGYRQDGASHLLVRAWPAVAATNAGELPSHAMLITLAQTGPDGLVVTDLDGRVLSANSAFVELAQLSAEAQVRGQSLDRWLGRSGVDLSVLISNLRQRGAVRLFGTTLRGEFGAATEVEISATVVPHGEQSYLGFTIRDVGRRLRAEHQQRPADMERAVGKLTELVGRLPLKAIVGETSDLIERMCIEAALEMTRDNRASAAEMLGLSRQSLYVKLRRHNMVDSGVTDD
jgi:transcriptional regulator PpsR